MMKVLAIVGGMTTAAVVLSSQQSPPPNEGIPERLAALEVELANRTGSVCAFGGNQETVPEGWLLCDGREVSRNTFAALFGVIGEAHGAGDGVTTFNLPDYSGRFLRGVDGAAARDPGAPFRTAMNAGGNVGIAVGSIQGDSTAIPATTAFATGSGGDHEHSIAASTGHVHGTSTGGVHSHQTATTGSPEELGEHTHYGLQPGTGLYPGDELGDGNGSPKFAKLRSGGQAPRGHMHAIDPSMGHDHGDTMSAGGHGHSATSAGDHTHILGGGDPETRPVNAYVNWIIKS